MSEQSGAVQASSQLYMDAIDILADQDDGKEGLSGDLFRQAIGVLGYPFLILTCSAFDACTEVLHLSAREFTLSMLGQEEPLGVPPIIQAFRTVLMSAAAFYSWGDQVGKVCGGSGPSDALCGCLRQTGVAALQSLSERSHHMALCPGCSTSLGYPAGGHPSYRSTLRFSSPHLSLLCAAVSLASGSLQHE